MSAAREVVFPVLSPREMTFSAVVRHHNYNGAWGMEDTLRRTVNLRRWARHTSIYNPLVARLADRMPPHHPQVSPQVLLDRHTVAPYFTYFTAPENREQFREDFLNAEQSSRGPLAYLRRTAFIPAPDLALCEGCLARDGVERRFTTWKVHHQLHGIQNCPDCGERLMYACRICDGGHQVSGELSLPFNGHCPHGDAGRRPVGEVYERDPEQPVTRKLATEALWILDHPEGFPGCWHDAMKNALMRNGYRQQNRLNLLKLRNDVWDRYGRNFCLQYGLTAGIEGRRAIQLNDLFHRKWERRHPLVYLAVSLMAYETIEELAANAHVGFERVAKRAPVKDVDALITTDLVARARRAKSIIRLAQGTGLTVAEIGRRLSEHPEVLEQLQARTYDVFRVRHRGIIERATTTKPGCSLQYLRTHFGSSVNWLNEHDAAWLAVAVPASEGPRALDAEVLQELRERRGKMDAGYAARVVETVARLKASPETRNRLSFAEIVRVAGIPYSVGSHRADWPETKKVLIASTETVADYARRRLSVLLPHWEYADRVVNLKRLHREHSIDPRHFQEVFPIVGELCRVHKLDWCPPP